MPGIRLSELVDHAADTPVFPAPRRLLALAVVDALGGVTNVMGVLPTSSGISNGQVSLVLTSPASGDATVEAFPLGQLAQGLSAEFAGNLVLVHVPVATAFLLVVTAPSRGASLSTLASLEVPHGG